MRIAGLLGICLAGGCARQAEPSPPAPLPPPAPTATTNQSTASQSAASQSAASQSTAARAPLVPSATSADSAAEPTTACEPETAPPTAVTDAPLAYETEQGVYGYKWPDGKLAIAPRFQYAFAFNAQGLAGAVLENKFVFIDRAGRVLANAFAYDNGPDYFQEGRARIVESNKFGFIDKSGAVIVKPQFDFAAPYCRGRAAVCAGCRPVAHGEHTSYEGGRWGFIDERGQVVIALDYDEVSSFETGSAAVTKGGQRFSIDAQGNRLAPQ